MEYNLLDLTKGNIKHTLSVVFLSFASLCRFVHIPKTEGLEIDQRTKPFFENLQQVSSEYLFDINLSMLYNSENKEYSEPGIISREKSNLTNNGESRQGV